MGKKAARRADARVSGSNLFFFFFLFRAAPKTYHREVARLGVESELQLLDYTPATATPDPSHICDVHHSSRQCWDP